MSRKRFNFKRFAQAASIALWAALACSGQVQVADAKAGDHSGAAADNRHFSERNPRYHLSRGDIVAAEKIELGDGGVDVRSATEHVRFPPGAFGFEPPALAERLEEARTITRRPEIIGELAAR